MDGQLSYAYAVVRPTAALERGTLQGLSGVGGAAGGPVRLVHAGEVAAVVSSVPEADFSEAALKVRLEDLDWLEAVARAHHTVVESLTPHATVLPLRLATVYLDDDRVRDTLRIGEAAFARMLDRLADTVEWGVKVYAEVADGSAGSSTGTSTGTGTRAESPRDGPADESDPGRAYLRRRRQQHRARGAAWSAAAEAVRRIEAEAGELALEHARHRPQQGQLAVGAGENVANDSYLVPGRSSGEFQQRVLRAAEDLPGVRVEITGPWAPYSFAALAGPQVPEGVRQP
ncbi:GvpL/GvpF family gas vesicle protein [Streptomyces sp. NPDC047928]|uniref:GvpL/GvpF family gas vesicle protein n=1 Tax=unclassified Streptomyces TaxID=2593676 RepID=UPI00371F54BF